MRKLSLNLMFAIAATPGFFYGQDWTNSNGTATPDLYRAGKVGTGTWYKSGDSWAWFYPDHGPQLEAACPFPLASNSGANSLISSVSSACGTSNWIRNNIWATRTGNGSSWSTTNIHDGISIDDQYKTPGSNTKTWWERNPATDLQIWGNNANVYMRLAHGKLALGTWYNPDDAANAWYGSTQAPLMELSSTATMASGIGSNIMLTTVSGTGGVGRIRSSQWLMRKGPATPYGFSNMYVHDGISIDASYQTPGSNTLTWWERDGIGDVQAWGNAGSTYMKLNQGRLGVNMQTPTARVDIQETDNNYSVLIARANQTADTKCIHSSVYRDNTMAYSVAHNNYGGQTNNWKETFIVYGDGRTRIGVQTVPSRNSLLQVNGEIDCRSLYVLKPATWQDRVFNKEYKLQDLAEVEKFIVDNKHLPGIKSEKEILENGYDVNEIDASLLEKIENLYLYVIKQEKQIAAQQKEINELKAGLK